MHLHQEIQLQRFLTLEKFPQQKFPHQIAGEIFITFKSGKRKQFCGHKPYSVIGHCFYEHVLSFDYFSPCVFCQYGTQHLLDVS